MLPDQTPCYALGLSFRKEMAKLPGLSKIRRTDWHQHGMPRAWPLGKTNFEMKGKRYEAMTLMGEGTLKEIRLKLRWTVNPHWKLFGKKNLDASDSFQQNSSWSKCQAAKPRCRIHQVAAPCKLWSKTVQHVFQEISTFKFHHASRVCRVRVCILSYIYIYFNYLQMYVWIHMHARIAFRKSTFGRAYHFAMVSSTQFWTSSLLTSGLVVSAYPLNQCELGWGIPNAKQMDCSSEVKDWNWIL